MAVVVVFSSVALLPYPRNPSTCVYRLVLLRASCVLELAQTVCCFERISFALEPNVIIMIDKNDNKRLRDATLAKVTREMDLPRLSASVERSTTRKLPSRFNTISGKMKKRVVLETSELSADMIRPTPLIHQKVKAAGKKTPK